MQAKPFNANEHLLQLKSKDGSKDYLPVQWRLVWFREQCPQGEIQTEMLHLDLERDTEEEAYVWNAEKKKSERVMKHANGFVVFRAIVKDGKGGIGTGTKSEKAASFPDFIEKAETGAIGRALAALGYGTQFAPELDEEHRIVDSPVERQPQPQSENHSHSSSDPVLDRMIGHAKNRAKDLSLAKDSSGWQVLLKKVGLQEIKTPADIAKINAYLNDVAHAIDPKESTGK